MSQCQKSIFIIKNIHQISFNMITIYLFNCPGENPGMKTADGLFFAGFQHYFNSFHSNRYFLINLFLPPIPPNGGLQHISFVLLCVLSFFLTLISICQFFKNLMTNPCVSCSIYLLSFSKLFRFPVGYLLTFGTVSYTHLTLPTNREV